MVSRVPSLNWLRIFEAAARTESFARAAAQLNLSAAAVSQQVKALEDRLGAPLFLRGAQSVTLTDLGRAYLPSVQRALGLLEEATESVFGAPRDEPVFVQSVLLFAHGILTRGLGAFQQAHPHIRVTLNTGNSALDFTRSFNDLQIVFGSPGHFGRDHDLLLGEVLYPVAPPPLAGQIETPQDLQSQTLIEVATHRSGWRYLLHALDLPPRPLRMLHADNTIIAAALCAQGLGVMLARAPASDMVVAQSGLVPCLPEVRVKGEDGYHLVCPDRAALRPAAQIFRRWVLDHVSEFADR